MPILTNGGQYSSADFSGFFIGSNTTISDDGVTTVSLQYALARNNGAPIDYYGGDYEDLVQQVMLPAMGMDISTWESKPLLNPQAFARLREIEIESLKTGEIIATCRFTTLYTIKPSTLSTATPYTHLPASVEFTSQLRAMKAWRRTWATNPPTASDQTSDIGGFAAANGRDGMIVEVPQVRFRMRFVQDATVTAMNVTATTMLSYVNKINSATFYNFTTGSVICEGVSCVKVSNEFYEVIFDFLYDAYNHHEQVPDYDPLGQVDINNLGNANVVKWTRVNRTSTDFNNIYGGDTTLKAIVEKGWWN
jgi:hypothetical protein